MTTRIPRVGRFARAGAGLALLGLVLAGCGLPHESGIQDGRRVGENVAPRARVVVNSPLPGASPDVIARDFIRAGAAFQELGGDQQVVGRSYLAPDSVDRWRPSALTTTVFDSRSPIALDHLPSDQVRLTATAVATIDESGHYRELVPGTSASVVFTMVKVGGEWRISLPQDGFGLWLNTDDFDQVFSAYETSYPVKGKRALVSDVRWLPTGARLPTALARAQLSGVPAYLAGVVDEGIPDGTRLAVDAVNVDATGIATVTLTNTPAVIDPTRRRAIWAQLVSTVLQAPGVSAVTVEVQGIGRIPISNLPPALSNVTDLGYTQPSTPPTTIGLARTGEVVQQINPQDLDETSPARPITKPTAKSAAALPAIPTSWANLAMSPDGTDVAAVAGNRSEMARWHGGVPIIVPAFGSALTNPSYASDGRLWVAGMSGGSAKVVTYDPTMASAGAPTTVTVAWLAGRQVINLAVSPDGTRVAVLSELRNGTDYRLDLAGVVRDGAGLPTALGEAYRQGEPLTRFVDVVWIDSMTMVVLARDRDADPLRPFRVDIGQGVGLRRVGQLDLDQTLIKEVPETSTTVSTRGGVRGLIVTSPRSAGTGGGVLFRVGNNWAAQPDVDEVVVAGG